jgi:CRISPR/Cas system CSM-associated protein Csm3 (group 7 of RAMP superfamily)
MPRIRYDITADLVARAPIHAGTGEARRVTRVAGQVGANDAPLVAAIARDAMGQPILPSTSLKGMLRSLLAGLPGDDAPLAARLLGEAKRTPTDEEKEAARKDKDGDSDGEELGGRMGLLTLFTAERTGPIPDATAMPYADKPSPEGASEPPPSVEDGALGPGVFVAARTHIDGASGTAADATLFFQEMVAPDTRFAFRGRLEARGRRAKDLDEGLEGLLRLLKAMTVDEGVPLGKGRADGLGRLGLDWKTLRVTRRALNNHGVFEETSVPITEPNRAERVEAVRRWTLMLSCEGLFAILDASRSVRKGRRAEGDNSPNAWAQRSRETLPLVLGPSLAGALRARAQWLWSLQRLGAESKGGPLTEAETKALERLFGTPEARGLLAIEELTVLHAEPQEVTQVKIDRFSGAPVDNALLRLSAFADVEIRLRLAVEKRPGAWAATDEDLALAERLINDLERDELVLGHGGNRGLGWFTVTREAV